MEERKRGRRVEGVMEERKSGGSDGGREGEGGREGGREGERRRAQERSERGSEAVNKEEGDMNHFSAKIRRVYSEAIQGLLRDIEHHSLLLQVAFISCTV